MSDPEIPDRLALIDDIVSCTGCDLHAQCTAPVPFYGPDRPTIAILGEAPGCFVPGTMVATPGGPRPIEDFRVGDVILAGDGSRTTVRAVMARPASELVEITTLGGWRFRCTPEHPLWSVPLEQPKSGHGRRMLGEGRWLPAELVCREEALFIPWPGEAGGRTWASLGIHALARRGYKSSLVPDVVEVDECLAFVCGLYMADGSASIHSSATTWHLSRGYKECWVSLVASVLRRCFGLEAKIQPKGERLNVQAYSRKLAAWFLAEFGPGVDKKIVPSWILGAREEVVNAFLFGWYEGDGNHLHRLTKARKIGTASEVAAQQAAHLFMRCRVFPALRREVPSAGSKGKLPMWYVEFRNLDVETLGWPIDAHDGKARAVHTVTDAGVVVPVASVDRAPYRGMVLNLETGSNDYLVPFRVHNSEEDRLGKPFVGPAGQLIRKLLREIVQVDPEECAWFNTVSCRSIGAPEPAHIFACAGHRERQLAYLSPTWLLILGSVALQSLRPELTITRGRGHPFLYGDTVAFAAYHPSAALRNRMMEAPLKDDLQKFGAMVRSGRDIWWRFTSDRCGMCLDYVYRYDETGMGFCKLHHPENRKPKRIPKTQMLAETVERQAMFEVSPNARRMSLRGDHA
jgi:uracil-DNA glycosylase